MDEYENRPETEFKEYEFNKGDVIIPIGGTIPCTIIGIDECHYFVRWFDSGDSMLWIDDVDKDYVRIEP